MRVYWISGKRTKRIQFHVVPSLAFALRMAGALKSCGQSRIWIEAGLAHRAIN